MLEDPADRVGGSHVTVHGMELAAWERLCLALRLTDVWQHGAFSHSQGSLSRRTAGDREGLIYCGLIVFM